MTNAISLHIGLNRVNPDCYEGWDGALSGCINDANAMKAIADSLGYTSTILLDEEATADRVIGEIGQAAYNLDPDGILFLSYSGHGGQLPDNNGDELDGRDETWVLYDRQLIDDEIYNLWSQFGTGARLIILSDSCHSGTVTRETQYSTLVKAASMSGIYKSTTGKPRFRMIPPSVSSANYEKNKQRYRALQFATGKGMREMTNGTVILISGCQDNQLSSDGDVNGLFTENLLKVWDNGSFSGNYAEFHQAILDRMPPAQSPNYYVIGEDNASFEAQTPFSIDPRAAASPDSSGSPAAAVWPSVTAPATATRNSPPTFNVNAGPGRYYALEIAADRQLFTQTSSRQDGNFFATWKQSGLLQAPTYSMQATDWDKIKSNSTLFYRILSNDNAKQWGGIMASDANAPAPGLAVSG